MMNFKWGQELWSLFNSRIFIWIIIVFITLLILFRLQACQASHDANKAIDERAKTLSDFEAQGKELKQVIDERGDLQTQATALKLSNDQLALLAEDLKVKIKNMKPKTIIQTETEIVIRHDTTTLNLPCRDFDTTITKKEQWVNYTFRLSPKKFILDSLTVPVNMIQTINERNRFLRSPEITIDTKFDNPNVHILQTSAAVEKKNKSFTPLKMLIAVGVGFIAGEVVK